MKKKSHDRAPDKRTITISCDNDLVEKIDALAAQANRTRSNFIVHELKNIVAQKNPKIVRSAASGVIPSTARFSTSEQEGEYKSRK